MLVAVGRAGNGPEAALYAQYAARLRPKLTLLELPEARGTPAERRRREAEAILAALPARAFLVALDRAGPSLASVALARQLQAWRARGSLAFVIGGAEGLDPAILARAQATLAFGPQTWPHLLARVMLAEQLWRAQAIAANHPYHRD
ncbi:MAG: 23S rRNA (pseudouridine(1915)-N(3))-methyltransferase RlmH [Rhodospirillales bacterium]|nr:23S rRNA (pseudouridine(1915)-N(3))-methyltransferase RlmH [Rhodospirillales bacterium]